MAHARQSRPDSGLDFQVKVLKTFEGGPSSLRLDLLQQHSQASNVKRFRGGLVFKQHSQPDCYQLGG